MMTDAEKARKLRRAFAEHNIAWPHGHGVTLFFDQSGPLIRYADRTLYIEDINPEVKIKWSITRGEMFKLGLRCIRAALTHQSQPQAGMGQLSRGAS
jgi:hypothetical protein